MLQAPESNSQKSSNSIATSFAPVKTVGSPVEQATIGRSLVIKGEISGSESLYIDGRIEGSINFEESRITIGRNGSVTANVSAREVVIMGTVKGNIQCSDRLDIRSEGSLTGDVITQRISVEDGAMLKGSVQIRSSEQKQGKSNDNAKSTSDQPKAAAATAGN